MRCSAGIVGRLVASQTSVGKRMLKWNSTRPRRAKERPQGPVNVSGKNQVRGAGVSPAGKEKATSGGHGKERAGLTTTCPSSDTFSVEARTAQDMVMNMETRKTTHFQRENNICCLEFYWVRPLSKGWEAERASGRLALSCKSECR